MSDDMFAFPYLSLNEIANRLSAICNDIDRMNFGEAKERAFQLEHRVTRMTTRGFDTLPKETDNG